MHIFLGIVWLCSWALGAILWNFTSGAVGQIVGAIMAVNGTIAIGLAVIVERLPKRSPPPGTPDPFAGS